MASKKPIRRQVVDTVDTKAEAIDAQAAMAKQLRQRGLTPSHRIGIREVRGVWWVELSVYDDES